MAIKRASQLLPSDNSTVLRPENFALGFTQSEIGTWDDCAEKWYLGYNHMLRKRGEFAWYFVYGDAFHTTLSNWYATGISKIAGLQFPEDVILSNEQQADARKWQMILEVQMERYFTYYQDDLRAMKIWLNEEIIEFTWQDVKLTGKIDLGYNLSGDSENVLMDHKSAGRFDPNALNGWQFRFQFMFYMWLTEKVTKRKIGKFVVNGMKKPALKQGKDESVESYCIRIKQDMIQRPEEYFKRVPLPMIRGSMEHFEKRVLQPKIDRIKLLTQGTDSVMIDALVRNQNTNNCVKYGNTCQFLPICQNGFKAEGFQYILRENKHEELEAE